MVATILLQIQNCLRIFFNFPPACLKRSQQYYLVILYLHPPFLKLFPQVLRLLTFACFIGSWLFSLEVQSVVLDRWTFWGASRPKESDFCDLSYFRKVLTLKNTHIQTLKLLNSYENVLYALLTGLRNCATYRKF